MLTLENDNLILDFDDTNPKAGYSSFRLKPGYYSKGFARTNVQYPFLNKINEFGELEITSSDYYTLLVEGNETGVSGLTWSVLLDPLVSSLDLYGKDDPYGNVDVEVIKIKSANVLDVGSNRSIKEQEIWYYFTSDGKGIIKRVIVFFNPPVSSAYNLQSIKILNFVGVHSIAPKLEAISYFFGKNQVGFDYDTLAAFNSDWSVDAGLTVDLARNSVYPNLLPAFGAADWVDLPASFSATTLNLTPGDNTYISVFNPLPDNRKHWLQFETQGLNGTLQVSFSLVRNTKNTESDAQVVNITTNGEHAIEFPIGFGYTWLFVRFKMLNGNGTVTNAYVQYRDLSYTFVAPDSSELANSNMMNCIRVQSTNPNTKQIYRSLSSTLFIRDGFGVGVSILSLDNTDIQDGAFRLIFQKPDNSWVKSAIINMFVDYNEKYGVTGAEQYNQWDDSLFGVAVPSGVDEIKAIGIEFTTTETIDWLVDGFFVLDRQGSEKGIGSDDRRNFGPGVDGLRARDFCLRGSHGVVPSYTNDIKMERVVVDPGVNSALTFTNVSSVTQVYYLAELVHSVVYSSIEDRGHEIIIDMSGVSDYFYATEVLNTATNETWRIKSTVGTNVVVDVSEKERNSNADLIKVTYKIKVAIPATDTWSFAAGEITWLFGASIYSGTTVYVDYVVDSRIDDPVGLIQSSCDADLATMRVLRNDISEGPPLLSNYNNAVLTNAANTMCETFYIYYPTKNQLGSSLYSDAQGVQDITNSLLLRSRKEPLNPLPRNYNLIPHIAFGGEQIAAAPLDYLIETKQHLDEARTSNGIVSAGSLSYLRDRDIKRWWVWGGSLHDTGIDYLKATRDMLRSGLTESQVSNYISRCRYFFEVTTFAYEDNKRYRSHASVDYKGDEKFKRVWYYQESGGLYTSRVYGWSDFQDSYYDPIIEGGKTYTFQYHYTLVIPAFWSIVTSKDDWGLSEDTIYNLMSRRINYLCSQYDCEGIIISELIHYREGFSDNDFSLYNTWCQANGFGAQADWPRFGPSQYVDPDDESRVWGWKRYQVKKYLTEMATVVHAQNKLLGVNVNVQNVISIANQNNPSWDGYDVEYNEDYSSWHVNTLEKSIWRYGTDYAELLKENICDFLWVWLYYSYSPFGKQIIYDFISQFNDYKERMILTIGLFPKANPPTECAIVALVRQLLIAGWNVCYAGYPPMLIQDERWSGVWSKLRGYVPQVNWDPDNEQIVVDPAQSVDIPFYARF